MLIPTGMNVLVRDPIPAADRSSARVPVARGLSRRRRVSASAAKPHGAARTEPTRGPEVPRTVQTTVRSPADQAPAPG